jgi:hypothetical protein
MDSGAASVTPGVWHHAAVTYDGATLNLYLDGALVNSQARTLESSDGGLLIGVNKNLASGFFSGRMDELLIYARALSATQIASLANPDVDGDGIYNDIDTQPFTLSNDFSDGTTSGSIQDRGDQTLQISDVPDPTQGVLAQVTASNGTTNPALIQSCNGAAQHSLDAAGDSVVITCGSVILDVLGGQVGNTLFATDGTTATVNLPAGNGLTFKPEQSIITATETNTDPITVNVGGAQKVVNPGSQATVVALNRFVALGEEGIDVGEDSVVISGSLGANQASGGPYLADGVETTISNDVQFQSPDSWLLGDSIAVEQGATVYDVYTNHAITGTGNVLGKVRTNISLPLGPAFPAIPSFTPGTQDQTIKKNGILTLDAGSFGVLQAGKGATVILTGGQYDFSAWDIGDNANIVVQAPVEIRIAGKLNIGKDVSLSPDPTSGLTASAVHFFVTGQNGDTGDLGATPAAAEFGNNDIIAASIYVPNGTLNIGNDTQASGAFLGKWVSVGNNTTLTLDSGW